MTTSTQEIKIDWSSEETTGWKRRMEFTYEDKTYSLTLYWDEFNGFDTYWHDGTPEFVINWDKEQSFEAVIDELTYEYQTKENK